MSEALDMADYVGTVHSWSAEPVRADSLARDSGSVIGFCNIGGRDRFEAAATKLDAAHWRLRDREPRGES